MLSRITTDTIAAIATPPGAGGVGIVRVSGVDALPLLKQLFVPHRPQPSFASHRLYYGNILARDGTLLDEVLAVYMQAPYSYTREDVVEFQCHASPLVLQELLEHLFTLGARPAEPGEFTKRAFLSGRIDLSQAEAVIDLLEARTTTGAGLAASQLQGALAQAVSTIRDTLVELMAQLEVAIDFPDEDADILDREEAVLILQQRVMAPIKALIADADQGRLYREGMRLVIAGLPNAGKSSLLNALLKEERALVTPHPGTTRDTIEEGMALNGIPVQLIDTAGIHLDQGDPVEALGMERARKMIAEADCILFLIDGQAGFTEDVRQLHASIASKRHVLVLNKRDLITEERERELRTLLPAAQPVVSISARKGEGMEALQTAILGIIAPNHDGLQREHARLAPNRRHRSLLTRALDACTACLATLQAGAPLDLLSVDVQTVLDCIGEISGHATSEEILDAVFSRFCIGK
ncbi:MAG: tRNA uridine-5-carboxymethylaminomethyl(34) synthesis GTPase MnmE [Desulfobulbaceae bacterium]|nr:tRNA uridine-5-carboxymethylaminomethyl(34) synthesis GTPase MnmE [Desulfobulbaceae bacterium]